MKKGKEKQEITVDEILPFINGKRVLNQYLGKSFLLSIGKKKILFNLGSGCLCGLLAKTEIGGIDFLAVSDSSPKAFGDILVFLNYRWEISKSLSVVKPIYLFGYENLNSNIKLVSEILFGRGTDNSLGVIDWSGEEKYFFHAAGISIEKFSLTDKNCVGFVVKAYGKKIVFLSELKKTDFSEISSFVSNSDCLIISECKISAEEVSEFREFKKRYSVKEILSSATNCPDYLCKYKLVSVCEDGGNFKIAEFIDVPSSVNALMTSAIMEDNFFVKIDPRDFFSETCSYFVSDRIGTAGTKDFNKNRIKFCCSDQFKRRFANKEEKNLKEADVVFGKLKDTSRVCNLQEIINPIRFFDLMYLISSGAINKKNTHSFWLVDKFNNLQLVILYYNSGGEWEICDNFSFEEELSENISNIVFISSIK